MIYTNILTKEKEQILTTNTNSNRYDLMKNAVRETAMQWQLDFENNNYSWGELLDIQSIFRKYGKRYGLLKEFMENGIC